MNVKKQVLENIKAKLVSQQNKLRYDCERNASKMKALAHDNEVMKRERAKLGELIKSLNLDSKG